MYRRNIRKTTKILWYAACTAACILAFAMTMLQFKIHTLNQWQEYSIVNTIQSPAEHDSVLVFAPHSDDETLGCGGLLAIAKENKARLKVVLLTNGDGFRFAAARTYKTVRITHQRMIDLAYKRQTETLAALKELGLSRNDVIFLGYPDRGLSRLWETNWNPNNPYTSPSTGWNYIGYVNAPSRYAPYCGNSLLKDILKILVDQKPTKIFIPHPMDNHPDHYVTYCFVTNALEQLALQGDDFATNAKVFTYLVHRGDWPAVDKAHNVQNLTPPYSMAQGDTKWKSIPLPDDIIRQKRAAIMCYKTQTNIEKNFLLSFARSNELFGVLPSKMAARVPQGYMTSILDTSKWQGIVPVVNDAVSDNVMAEMSEGGDVRSIYACQDGRLLFLRIDFSGRLSRRLTYTISVKEGDLEDKQAPYMVKINKLSKTEPKRQVWSYKDNSLQIAIPLNELHNANNLYIRVTSHLANLRVDNTGWRTLILNTK